MPKFIKKHYHWLIAVVLFLIMAIRGGIGNNISLHIIPVTEAMGITRGELSLATSATQFVGMLSTLFSGAMIIKYGYRGIFSVFLGSNHLSYTGVGMADAFWLYAIANIATGIITGVCGDAGATRVVSSWFHKQQGLVLGLITSATGLGGSILCIFQTAAIEKHGYPGSYFLSAILMGICAVLAFTVVRTRPSDIGNLPYGDGEIVTRKKREHEHDHWLGADMKALTKRPAFYMMLFGTLLSCTMPYLAFSVVVPFLQDEGFSPTQASSVHSVILLALTGAKILAGLLCDTIGAKKVALICMGFNGLALLLLANVQSLGMAMAFAVIFSMGLPIVSVIPPLLSVSLFGYRSQVSYTGIFVSMVSCASMIANPATNAIYDAVGTYKYTFIAAGVFCFVLIGGYLIMYRLAGKDRARIEAETAAQN